jgi:hypothetical protein
MPMCVADVERVIATWTVTAEDLDHLFAEQGRRWQHQAQATPHARDVERFCALVGEQRAIVGQIHPQAHELQAVTMERLLAKSDLEVGLDAILGPSVWGVAQPDVRRHPR